MTKTLKSLLAVTLLLTVILVGCTTSRITIALNVAALATSTGSTTVASVSSLDPSTRSQITGYLSAVTTALTAAANDLKSGTITGPRIASISADLAAAVVPNLPDSVPTNVKTALTSVSTAVRTFVSLLEAENTRSLSARSVKPVQLKLSYRDRAIVGDSLQLLEQSRKTLSTDQVGAK